MLGFMQSNLSIKISLFANNSMTNVPTFNLIAETKTGSATDVIVIGSHSDSVPAGPGINDNGSGSSSNLELAVQFYKQTAVNPTVNKVRFAWWAAEEFGLLGSQYYVKNLPQPYDVAAYLNYDMIGSPNYYRGIYNGSQASESIRPQSQKIQSIYQDFFNSQNLTFELSAFTGRSDYGPFIQVGIPSGENNL